MVKVLSDEELAAIKAELKAELLAELTPKPKPAFVPEPARPTTTELAMGRAGMSAEAMRPMVAVVNDATMRDIARRGGIAPLKALGAEPPARQRGSGWQNPSPLDVPGGARSQDLIERGVNAALPHGPGNPAGAKKDNAA
jgi:hypothetical protein